VYNFRVKIPALEGAFEYSIDNTLHSRVQALHGENTYTVELCVIAWTSLLADTPLQSELKPVSSIKRFFHRTLLETKAQILLYGELADALLSSLEHSDQGITMFFDRRFMTTPIFREYHEFYHTHRPDLLKWILSFCYFAKKLSYVDPELKATAFRKWLDVEERLRQIDWSDPIRVAITSQLRKILSIVFEKFRLQTFLPVHGSGAVATRGVKAIDEKCRAMSYDARIDALYFRWSTGNPMSSVLPNGAWESEEETQNREARLEFVDKDMRNARSICMEPPTLQYSQQGVRLYYELFLTQCPFRKYIDIYNQQLSQDAAVFGSDIPNSVDTIDLSSASDSVAWEMVKTIFPSQVLKHLAATRSTTVLTPYQSDPIKVLKFAPMGSALCFPVQSTIYAAVSLLAAVIFDLGLGLADITVKPLCDYEAAMERLFYEEYSITSGKLQPFRIYGDDIACDSRVTSITIDLLRQLGFVVNEEKSFVGYQACRESCGIYAFNGADVTPIRYKVKPVAESMKIEALGSFIDLANRALAYNYVNLRSHMIHIVLFYRVYGVTTRENPVLFTRDRTQSFAIFSENPHNTRLRKRIWRAGQNPNSSATYIRFQRSEVRSITVTMRGKRVVKEYDNYFYVAWQRSHFGEEVKQPIYLHGFEFPEISTATSRYASRGVRVGWRWTPAGD